MDENKTQEPVTNVTVTPEQFKIATRELKNEITNSEYFKSVNLDLKIFQHQELGKSGTMIKVMKNTKVLYVRFMEGTSEEITYTLVLFLYKDIFNQGLMFMDRLSIEQEKMDKEKEIIETVGSMEKGKIINLKPR